LLVVLLELPFPIGDFALAMVVLLVVDMAVGTARLVLAVGVDTVGVALLILAAGDWLTAFLPPLRDWAVLPRDAMI